MGIYGIDWSKGEEGLTEEDYAIIFVKATEIINTNEPKELLPGAYYDRGIIYYSRDDYDNAIFDFTTAIQLCCKHLAAAYYNRGLAFYCKKQYEFALSDFYNAKRINPKDIEIENMIQQTNKLKI